MTGCLLFGPPGTGKTLVVRALAKEAGCRMLAISPSDVMDMVRTVSCRPLITRGLLLCFFESTWGRERSWSAPCSR
jgi:hypothetical protein